MVVLVGYGGTGGKGGGVGGYFFSVIQTITKALKCSFKEHAVETTTFGAIAVMEFQ